MMLPPLRLTVRLNANGNHRASDARSAAGRRARMTDGSAPAATSGTPSTPGVFAQPASTNGLRRDASSVALVAAFGSVCRVTSISSRFKATLRVLHAVSFWLHPDV
jgi:hypothetical protein